MGFGYTNKAGDVLDRFEAKHCIHGSSNVFHNNGNRYFFEVTRRDQKDGGICGSIHKFLPGNMARQTGTFRINGDGTVKRGPKILKDCVLPRGVM